LTRVRQASILTDITRCIGCERCVAACNAANKLGQDLPWRWKADDGLSADRFTSIIQRPGGHYVRKLCMHCLNPACVSACPVGAMQRTAEGAVIYDSARCMGCRYCMMACPFGVPRYSWNQSVPYVRKCLLDSQRLRAGKQPVCTEACPTGATLFGEREELLDQAHRRIKAEPGRYLPRVFGEEEVGGTAKLYIAGIDLGFLAMSQDPGTLPYPERTWAAIRLVPPVFVGVGALLGGVHWAIRRRQQLAAEEAVTRDE